MPSRRRLIVVSLVLLSAAQPALPGTPTGDAPARFSVSDETLQVRSSADARFSVSAVEAQVTPSPSDVRFRLHATTSDKAACSIGGPALFSDGFES